MNDELRVKLEALKFQPDSDVGALRVRTEDVEFVAVEHPSEGVALIVSDVGPRPLDGSFREVHPERRRGPGHATR